MKTLYFEGAGWSGADISIATIGNCRIRTAFHLDNGRAVYLEMTGSERTKYSTELYQWQYTGFVHYCHYITNDNPNDDQNQYNIHLKASDRVFEYTESEILRIVNGLGASFDEIKVVPDLGGFRVFPEKNSCSGLDGYNYGDEFRLDPELLRRRKEVYQNIYMLEKSEGKEFPNFSLWVDENDPGVLHLLRHFSGHNKHFVIHIDVGDTLVDWLTTSKETHLGRYGC